MSLKVNIACLLFLLPIALISQIKSFDLADLFEKQKLTIVDRDASIVIEGGKKFLKLSEGKGEGLVWLNDKAFKKGAIEIKMRGKDVFQKSFIGIAFHVVNDTTFDAVYCRPFNFYAKDSVRRIHAIQYISHPEHTWKKLRETRNAEFEKEIPNAPDPNDWFTMRLVVDKKTVKAYIDNSPNPVLVVNKLNDRKNGKIGLFLGDGAGGDFRVIKF